MKNVLNEIWVAADEDGKVYAYGEKPSYVTTKYQGDKMSSRWDKIENYFSPKQIVRYVASSNKVNEVQEKAFDILKNFINSGVLTLPVINGNEKMIKEVCFKLAKEFLDNQ